MLHASTGAFFSFIPLLFLLMFTYFQLLVIYVYIFQYYYVFSVCEKKKSKGEAALLALHRGHSLHKAVVGRTYLFSSVYGQAPRDHRRAISTMNA